MNMTRVRCDGYAALHLASKTICNTFSHTQPFPKKLLHIISFNSGESIVRTYNRVPTRNSKKQFHDFSMFSMIIIYVFPERFCRRAAAIVMSGSLFSQ
jgi:hypothetical protein